MDIKGVLGLKKGTAFQGLKAKVIGVFDYKTNGKYSSQSIRIEDNTGAIYCTLNNFEIDKSEKGKDIIINTGVVNVYYSKKYNKNEWNIVVNKPEDIVIGEIEKPVENTKQISNSKETDIRSIALSYAKDLACAGKIEVSNIISQASMFNSYILGYEIVNEEEKAEDIPF